MKLLAQRPIRPLNIPLRGRLIQPQDLIVVLRSQHQRQQNKNNQENKLDETHCGARLPRAACAAHALAGVFLGLKRTRFGVEVSGSSLVYFVVRFPVGIAVVPYHSGMIRLLCLGSGHSAVTIYLEVYFKVVDIRLEELESVGAIR